MTIRLCDKSANNSSPVLTMNGLVVQRASVSPREDGIRERVRHAWASSSDSFLKSILSYVAIFREAPDWPVVMTQ